MIQIQQRDRQILRCCYEQQFLLFEHVERFFYQPGNERDARRRIAKLAVDGFVLKQQVATLGGRQLIRLTPKGISVAREFETLEVPEPGKVDLRTLTHDALLTSVRLRLQQLWDGVWIPERALKAEEYPRIPDGLMVFPSGRKIAIELENSAKGRTRFLGIIDSWRGTEILMVLYVAIGEPLRTFLQKTLNGHPAPVVIGVIEWDQLRTGTPSVWTTKGPANILTRRTF